MPRKASKTEETNEIKAKKPAKTTKSVKAVKTTKSKTETVKKETKKKTTTSSKKTTVKTTKNDSVKPVKSTKKNDSEKKVVKKTTATAKKAKTPAKKTTKTTTSKITKKTTTKKTTTKTKTTTTRKKAVKKSPIEVLEYYDLPYRYNQTVVKVLAQTPNILFVYWDISDEDKQNFIKQYGEYFFNNTKPVLIIRNETLNYEYEIDINDFANSWYLKIQDTKCNYDIKLGRRPINHYVSIPNNFLYITRSNKIETPNDHILFERMPSTILFRNVKTNETNSKSISSISSLIKLEELYKSQEYNLKYANPTSTFK